MLRSDPLYLMHRNCVPEDVSTPIFACGILLLRECIVSFFAEVHQAISSEYRRYDKKRFFFFAGDLSERTNIKYALSHAFNSYFIFSNADSVARCGVKMRAVPTLLAAFLISFILMYFFKAI